MHDDDLSRRLALIADDAERRTRIDSAPGIRERADGRGRTAGGMVAAALVVALGLAALVSYSLLVTVAPGGRPTPATTGSTAWPDPTSIPQDLTMPHEGEAGWQRLDDRSIASAFVPCRVLDPSAPDVTVPGRTDARTMTGRDPNPQMRSANYTEHLFVYEDEDAARAAMRQLVEGVAGCGWHASIQLGVGSEPEQLYSARSLREPADPYGPFAYATALHRGNVLFVVYGPVDDSMTPGDDGMATHAIGDMLCERRQLCAAQPAAEATWIPVTPRAR